MVKNTLNVGSISEGFVLDHIEAGRSMDIYKYLHLDKLDCCVAIIKNAKSNKMGKKDIIKIEGDVSSLNFDVLGYLDPQITITYIENGHVTRKVKPDQPQRLVNVVRCTNPRCITAIEEGCDHIFALTPSGKYRCIYCEQEFTANLNGENVRLVKK